MVGGSAAVNAAINCLSATSNNRHLSIFPELIHAQRDALACLGRPVEVGVVPGVSDRETRPLLKKISMSIKAGWHVGELVDENFFQNCAECARLQTYAERRKNF